MDNGWQKIQLNDLRRDISYEVAGKIQLVFRQLKSGGNTSTQLSIANYSDKPLLVQLEWENMTDADKGITYTVYQNEPKQVIFQSQKITIHWQNVQSLT